MAWASEPWRRDISAAFESYFKPIPLRSVRAPERPIILKKLYDRRKFACAMLGGGSLISPSPPNESHFLERYEDCVRRARRSVVFGTGVSLGGARALSEWLPRWRRILGVADYVGVRGPRSQVALETVGVNAEIVGDPVAHFVKPAVFWTPEDNAIGINFGRLVRQRELQPGLEGRVARLVAALHAEGWRIRFFCVWPKDLAAIRSVISLSGIERYDLYEHYEAQDVHSYLEHVRRCSVFVGMKLHACALAICAGVPTVSLAYHEKCADFLESVGLLQQKLDPAACDDTTLMEKVTMAAEDGRDNADGARRKLEHFKSLQVARASQLVAEIQGAGVGHC